MTNRELLELAAKACGELTESWYGDTAYFSGVLRRWNPLEDDGDAFRLAVKLKISVSQDIDLDGNGRVVVSCVFSDTLYGDFEYFNNDPYKATRRAIVRAAAEIGRLKEKIK